MDDPAVEKRPAGQNSQDRPPLLNVPAVHSSHSIDPRTVAAFPGEHFVHEATPAMENFPIAHCSQAIGVANVPLMHVAQVIDPAPGLAVPSGQGVHTVAPCADEVPGGHRTQTFNDPLGFCIYAQPEVLLLEQLPELDAQMGVIVSVV